MSVELEVRNLTVHWSGSNHSRPVLHDVSFQLRAGSTLGLIGGSGSGKTTLALALARLLPTDARVSGEIWWRGKNLLTLRENEIQKIRGREIALVFQEPATALNPVYTCGQQIREALRLSDPAAAPHVLAERTRQLLQRVQWPDVDTRLNEYPHQFSGGQRQRLLLALAMAGSPRLLVADEPTSSLDVTVQAQILTLLRELRRESQLSMILISHDGGVIREMCDDVLVLHEGRLLESGPWRQLRRGSRESVTRALLSDGEGAPP